MSKQKSSNERMKLAGNVLVASWLPKAHAKKIHKIAKRETVSAACVIRCAVRDFLANYESQTNATERLAAIPQNT